MHNLCITMCAICEAEEQGQTRVCIDGVWWYRQGFMAWCREGETARGIERRAEAEAWRRRVQAWRESPRGW